jgi:hypothetical protein
VLLLRFRATFHLGGVWAPALPAGWHSRLTFALHSPLHFPALERHAGMHSATCSALWIFLCQQAVMVGTVSSLLRSPPALPRPSGDVWTLGMQCGPSNNVQRSVDIPLPPGAAYMLSKQAQGRTFWCTRHKVSLAWATQIAYAAARSGRKGRGVVGLGEVRGAGAAEPARARPQLLVHAAQFAPCLGHTRIAFAATHWLSIALRVRSAQFELHTH